MKSIDPKDLSPSETQRILTCAVAPRPIAWVSTLSNNGIANLAPFSFFNAFGSNPPILGFSPARRARDGSTKDTYNNLIDQRECVVHIVNYKLLHQMNISSGEYAKEISEFEKAGLTRIESEIVKVPRIQEAPIHFECRLQQMIELGNKAGSGNLALCEIVKIHIDKTIITDEIFPDPYKVDHIARNGGACYTHANKNSIFELIMPRGNLGIGFDALPAFIRNSSVLTGNELGQLASVQERPKEKLNNINSDLTQDNCHAIISDAIKNNNIDLAWSIINEFDQ